MGNSLSITPNSSDFKGSPLLELQADGTIDNKHQGNILRKHIYDVLMNRKENVNGNTVDVNKLKVFCRRSHQGGGVTPASRQPMGNYTATGPHDFISLALPYVTNTAPNFILGTSDSRNLNLEQTIKTTYVPFNYHPSVNGENANPVKVQDSVDKDKMDFKEDKCDAYIGAACGKQIFDNKCIIDTSSDGSGTYSIDPNNKKCFKDKTESGQLISEAYRKFSNEEKSSILASLSDMGYDKNNKLNERKMPLHKPAPEDGPIFADYIIQHYMITNYLKVPWNHYRYARNGSPENPNDTAFLVQVTN